MKGLVMEVRDGFAAVFREDGAVVKVRQSCQVGETIELPDLPRESARNAWSAAMGALSAKLSQRGNASDADSAGTVPDAKTELSDSADAKDIISDTVRDALDERKPLSRADTVPGATGVISDTVRDALDRQEAEPVAEASEPTAVWDAPKAAPVNLWEPSEPVADAPESREPAPVERQEPETVWTAPDDSPSAFSDADLQAAATDITSDTIWDASEPADATEDSEKADAAQDSDKSARRKSRKTIPFPAGLHVLDAVKDRVSSSAKWRKSPWFRGAIAAAAALVILSGSVTYNTAFACSYVSIDVDESSIELSINRMGRVIAVNAISADAAGLAQSIESDVKNKTVDDAVSLTMDALKDAGYLDSANGEIIASVTSNTEKRSMELTQTVAQTMEGNKKDGVKLYLMEASNGDRNAALTRKVSPGRYLIQRSGMDTLPPRSSNDSQSEAVPVSQPAPPESPDQPDLSAVENLPNPALQAGTAALAGASQPADGATTTPATTSDSGATTAPATTPDSGATTAPAATTDSGETTAPAATDAGNTKTSGSSSSNNSKTSGSSGSNNSKTSGGSGSNNSKTSGSSGSNNSKTSGSSGSNNSKTSGSSSGNNANRNTGTTSQPTQTKPAETQPVAEPETPPATQPEREPDTTPVTQPEREPENRPAQPEPEPENRPTQPEPEPESRPAQPEPEPESRPTQPEPEPESRPAQPEPEPESRLNTPPVEPEPEQLWGNDRPATQPRNNGQPSGETAREDPGETTGHVVRNDPEPVQPSGPDDGETTAPVSKPANNNSEPVRPAAPDAGETTRPANGDSERPANNGGGESPRPSNDGGGESASVLSPEPPKPVSNGGGESSAPSDGGESARPANNGGGESGSGGGEPSAPPSGGDGGGPSGNGGESSRPDNSDTHYNAPSGQPPM